jgi:hypothetical protein
LSDGGNTLPLTGCATTCAGKDCRPDEVAESVLLAAKAAADRAASDWQYSTDPKTWTAAPQTLKAMTSISGLTAGTTYYFRVQALIKTGEQNWSQVVSLLVS